MLRTRLARDLISQESEIPITLAELAELIYNLEAPHTQNLYILILDYYCHQGNKSPTDRKGEPVIPYKGKSPVKSRKNADKINILFNIDEFPDGLRNLIVAYVSRLIEE